MSCTDKNHRRRRRIVAAVIALPLSLGFSGTAMATASVHPAASLPAVAAENAAENAAGSAGVALENAADNALEHAAAVAASATDGLANGSAGSRKADPPTAEVEGPAAAPPLSNADTSRTGAKPGSTSTTPAPPPTKPGEGTASVTVTATCDRVSVTSTKDISNVVVFFTDGTSVKFDGLSGLTWTQTFTKTVTSARAKSATTVVTDVATGCGGGGGGGGEFDNCPNMDGNQPAGTSCEKVDNDRIKFCHATGSTTHPYELIETSKAGALNGHYGVDHQGGRDIIPAFTYKGVNYAPQGDQSLLATGCVAGTGGGGGEFDNCPNMDGNQPAGTSCEKVDNDRIKFCHATGSTTHPYELIETSKAGALNGHYGVDHQGGRDIIPAFTYKGVNYAPQGDQSLLATGCVAGTGGGGGEFDNCPNIDGNQPAGTSCGGGGEFDNCPNIDGNQPAGTSCGGGGEFDNCPNMPGNQPAGTNCGGSTGGGGGGGGEFDNCPDMPGNQVPNTVCTVGNPNPNPNPPGAGGGAPIGGVTPPQAGSNPPPTVVPNAGSGPAVISRPVARPAAAPQARAVPSALPFTGTDAELLAQLGLLLLVAGAGVTAAARPRRTARAAA